MHAIRGFAKLLAVLLLAACGYAQQVRLDAWDFLPDPSSVLTIAALPADGWRPARAGLSWNAQFSDMRDYASVAWYRAAVDIPKFETPRRVLLRFGAVDYLAEIFINGQRVGAHEGGYTPFTFDITERVHAGRNQIAVRVADPPNKGELAGIRYDEIPHGKQNWYVQTSGLWQPVVVEFRPQQYLEKLRVTPREDGEVRLEVMVAGVSAAVETRLHIAIHDRAGREVFTTELPGQLTSNSNRREIETTARIPSPELWSPEHPALYTAEARLAGDPPDRVSVRFGFRRMEARDGRLFLNGRPFYMIGALDQDFYPDTIYSPPSAAYIRREMEAAKQLGLNTLRCHIKVCPPAYLDAADEAGIVVWYEIPNWDHFSTAAAQRGDRTLEEMVARDWNHPSILVQSIINESWGIDLKQAEQRRWLRSMYDRARLLTAPLGRLIVDNSPCCENFHLRTDLNDFHQYYSIPDHAAQWDRWVADFALRPKWTFSPHGDGEPTGGEPLIVSEFGNWGLPQLPAELPWWFNLPRESEITRPTGVLDRFRQYRFERIFPNYGALATATQRRQFASLKHEIEEIRRYASIQGYVITEFTDINWESNGLLDMWRKPKIYAPELRQIQQADVVFARFPRRNYNAGEEVAAEIVVSHFSPRDLRDCKVYWWTNFGAQGEFAVDPAITAGSVISQKITFPTPRPALRVPAEPAPKPWRERLFLELRSREGELLAANSDELFVYPRPRPPRAALAIPPDDPLAGTLKTSGYNVASESAPADSVLLTHRFDDRVLAHLRNGGRAVLLIDSADALPASFPFTVQERKGDYDGNWVSNFAWVLPNAPPFQNTGASAILGWEAAEVTPRFVLRGVAPERFDDVLAGMFYGWINNNSPLLLQARVGRGAVLMTTFRFDRYGEDPFATALLDGILSYVSTPQFTPRWELLP